MAITKEQAKVGTRVRFTGNYYSHLKGMTGTILINRSSEANTIGVRIDNFNSGHPLNGIVLSNDAQDGYWVTLEDVEIISSPSTIASYHSYSEKQFIEDIEVRVVDNPKYEGNEDIAGELVKIRGYLDYEIGWGWWIETYEGDEIPECDLVGYEKPYNTHTELNTTKVVPKVTTYEAPKAPSYTVAYDPYRDTKDSFTIDASIFSRTLPILNTNN